MKNNDILLLENIIKQFLFEQVRPLIFKELPDDIQTNFKTWLITQPKYNDQKLTSSYYNNNINAYAVNWWNQLDDKLKKTVSEGPGSPEELKKREEELEEYGLTPEQVAKMEAAANFKPGTYDPETGFGKCINDDYEKENDNISSVCVLKSASWWMEAGEMLIYIGYGAIALLALGSFALFNRAAAGIKGIVKGLMKYTKRFIMFIIGKRASNKMLNSDSAMAKIFSEIDDIFAALEKDMITRFGPDSPNAFASKKQIKLLIQEAKALMKTPAVRVALEKDFREYMKGLLLDGKITKQLYIAKMGRDYTKTSDMITILRTLKYKKIKNPNFGSGALDELPKEVGPQTIEAIENMILRR